MSNNHKSTNNIRLAFVLNFLFTIVEIVGGFWISSIAILSDALHDFGDSISLGLSWYLEKVSQKKRTKGFTYGYRRFSLLAVFINSVILIGGSLYILSEAIPKIINQGESNVQGMFILAVIGIIVNGLAFLRTRKGKTMNERVVTWHLLEDVLGWAAILIASVAMMIWEIPILDPILAVLITLYILWNVIKNLKKTVTIFLQGVPETVEISDIEKGVTTIP